MHGIINIKNLKLFALKFMPFWILLKYFSRAVLNIWTQCFIIVTLELTLLRQVRAKLRFPFSAFSLMSSL